MAGEHHWALRRRSLVWDKARKAMDTAQERYGKQSAEYELARANAIDAQSAFVDYASRHVNDLYQEYAEGQLKIDELQEQVSAYERRQQARELVERAGLDNDIERRIREDLGNEGWER